MAVSVIDATADRRAFSLFLDLPEDVYRADTFYCRLPRSSVFKDVMRDAFRGSQRVLIARRSGQTVARVVARRSGELTDDAGRPLGMLGFFEAFDDQEAVDALLDASICWLKGEGALNVVGPMNGDTWHSYRFNVGPFDSPPFLMEPYNPPYYPMLWERFGFTRLETYYSQHVEDARSLMDSQVERHDRALANDYTMRRLDKGRFRQELETIYRLSRDSFADNFLYTEIPFDEFARMYMGARRLMDPDLTWFAVAPDGTDAGFLFGLPDEHRAVAAMRGRRDPLTLLRFAMARGKAEAVNIKTAAVAKAHRRMGLFAALTFCTCREALKKGYSAVNLCLIKEDNPSGALADSLADVLRRYVLYQYKG